MGRERKNVRKWLGCILGRDEVVPLAPVFLRKTLNPAGFSSLLSHQGPQSIFSSPGNCETLAKTPKDPPDTCNAHRAGDAGYVPGCAPICGTHQG